ncbi:RcnB family protein [Phenylobacterium sp.]|jgi:Ni/Co efflux regulator RcnB|uniref:RcnB family protein n=1 Tax=Phenylobacterium sp. TaxID=1871053 RepID=UPI002ED94090
MKRCLLLSAVVACLVLPGTALADPPTAPQRGADKADHDKETPKGKGADKGRHEGAGQPVQTPAAPERPVRPNPPPSERTQARPPGQARVQPPAVAPPAALSLGEWRAPARGPARDRAGQQWRQEHQSWDRYATWRRSPDWWRSDSGFRLFVGPRVGFFFVPQVGYVRVPRQYRNHHWREGEYLPRWFRAYTVSHYERYGLPRPPRGCVWIWLNGDVALIDRSDGYILDIARNAWR